VDVEAGEVLPRPHVVVVLAEGAVGLVAVGILETTFGNEEKHSEKNKTFFTLSLQKKL
jgi:hypothetical protein